MALGPTSNPESNPGPERPVARHPSGIATPKANMCRDHNPSTQKTVGIHWDSCKKRTIPDDPSTHKRPRMFLIYYDDVLKFTTTHINSSAYQMTPASSAIPSTSCTTETGCPTESGRSGFHGTPTIGDDRQGPRAPQNQTRHPPTLC